MRIAAFFPALTAAFFAAQTRAADVTSAQKEDLPKQLVVGWVERVKIYPGEFVLKARIDTGAKSSSINAPHATTFQKNGETWVRFELSGPKGKETVLVEKKVERRVKIKRKGGPPKERVVIRLAVCLGNLFREIEVNLADRRGFNYPVLIGRLDLANTFDVLVNSRVKNSLAPSCTAPLQAEASTEAGPPE